jgi:hypothetical protein
MPTISRWAAFSSGELGIRTPGTFHSSTVFKTAAIDHSANSPGTKVQIRGGLANLNCTFFNIFLMLLTNWQLVIYVRFVCHFRF